MLYFIPTPIGNLSDVSLHILEVLAKCEVIFCEDTRVTKKFLNLLQIRYSLKLKDITFYSLHSHNEDEILKNIDLDIFNKICAYMSDAGMPCISDPGNSLVKFAQKNKIKYEVLSGSNALILAAVASGLVEKEFSFLGFLPNKGDERKIAIQNALNSPYPTIIYESPKRVLNLIKNIADIDPQRKIFIIKEATKKFETKYFDKAINLAQILENENLNGEFCLVIDKSKNTKFETILESDILDLDIPPKQKSKLLSKITGINQKEIYKNLIK